MTRPIVVGYDGTGCSREALAVAAGLAEGTAGELVLVYCHEVPAGLGCQFDPLCDAARELREFEWHVEQEVRPLLDEAAELVRGRGLEAETAIAWDECAAGLIRVARDRDACLIVVGSHGEGAVSAMVRRSPCRRLLHGSPLPVLVVPQSEEARVNSG